MSSRPAIDSRAPSSSVRFQAPSTDNIFVSIRKAITTLRAAGYNPDVVALTPAASETIDTMVSGITGGSADFTFGAGNFGPNNIFGLRRVESKTLAAPVVWDSANHGRFYMADVSLARFEESAGRTNTSLVRLETHAAYGTERAAAAVRIALVMAAAKKKASPSKKAGSSKRKKKKEEPPVSLTALARRGRR